MGWLLVVMGRTSDRVVEVLDGRRRQRAAPRGGAGSEAKRWRKGIPLPDKRMARAMVGGVSCVSWTEKAGGVGVLEADGRVGVERVGGVVRADGGMQRVAGGCQGAG